MQISSPTETHPLAMLSSSAHLFHDDNYVASPQPFHFLPFDICTQVGGYPLATLGRTNTSLSSSAATSHLVSSRTSPVDKGKGPLIYVPPISPPFPESTPKFSLTNISHPCPITISPPLTHPAHITDFLARWPQPFSPRPIIHPPPQHSTLGHFSSIQTPLGPSQLSLSATQFPFYSTSTHSSLSSFASSPTDTAHLPLNPIGLNEPRPLFKFIPFICRSFSPPLHSPCLPLPFRQSTHHHPLLNLHLLPHERQPAIPLDSPISTLMLSHLP